MRDYDEEDPKKPKPIRDKDRRTTTVEASEHDAAWSPLRKDLDLDQHRHV
jgi:hypothetical protein